MSSWQKKNKRPAGATKHFRIDLDKHDFGKFTEHKYDEQKEKWVKKQANLPLLKHCATITFIVTERQTEVHIKPDSKKTSPYYTAETEKNKAYGWAKEKTDSTMDQWTIKTWADPEKGG